jgi:hypothetical protein
MTVINGIEIDILNYDINYTKEAITNNDPIEDKLHVIAVISNPAQFARRYILAKEFIHRMEEDQNVIVYVVELAYDTQKYHITDSKNKRHLQLRSNDILWHKENMINVGVNKLLPKGWKAFAWIDADVEFENPSWAKDTLKLLNGYKDIVQTFSHAIDMDTDESAMRIFTSFGYQYEKKQKYNKNQENFWHPGYAWAITRKAYERIGGLYEYAILGSGDNIMSLCLINNGLKGLNEASTDEYKRTVEEFQKKMRTLRLGYTPGVLRHHYHGSKQRRGYNDRWKILTENNYEPLQHVSYDKNGLLIPTISCPQDILDRIKVYFYDRQEDEFNKPSHHVESSIFGAK